MTGFFRPSDIIRVIFWLTVVKQCNILRELWNGINFELSQSRGELD